VARYGVAGVLLGMTLESAGVPIPSEVILPLGGLAALAAGGTGPLALVVAAGTLGNVLGSAIAYGIGAAAGAEWRGARWLDRRHWEAAHRWFARHGDRAVLLGRVLPVVRTYISFPAGAAAMDLGRFLAYTAAGSAVWSAALAAAGYALGARWEVLARAVRDLGVAVLAALVLAAGLWVLRRFPGRR
jgi:membrane protein DedA with SNARE-associated domain